jgi:hypothetical protein
MAKRHCAVLWIDEGKFSVVSQQDVINPEEFHEGRETKVRWTDKKPYNARILKISGKDD